MILGIGTDLVDVRRVQKLLKRHEQRFLNRCFTRQEVNDAYDRLNAGIEKVAARLATRLAAKEACAKALGTGFRQGIGWRDIEVVNTPDAAPTLQLRGNAAVRLRVLTFNGGQARLHLSLTDEHPYAQAFVVIENVG
jgi:holo-[acyl-carrier protein] synthase